MKTYTHDNIEVSQFKNHRYFESLDLCLNNAYKTKKNPGVAWNILGYEVEPDEDTEWSGIENPTGFILAYMVGDDEVFRFKKGDLIPIEEDNYCCGCGQIGCGH